MLLFLLLFLSIKLMDSAEVIDGIFDDESHLSRSYFLGLPSFINNVSWTWYDSLREFYTQSDKRDNLLKNVLVLYRKIQTKEREDKYICEEYKIETHPINDQIKDTPSNMDFHITPSTSIKHKPVDYELIYETGFDRKFFKVFCEGSIYYYVYHFIANGGYLNFERSVLLIFCFCVVKLHNCIFTFHL